MVTADMVATFVGGTKEAFTIEVADCAPAIVTALPRAPPQRHSSRALQLQQLHSAHSVCVTGKRGWLSRFSGKH